VFHPNGKWVYVVTEIGSTIIQFNWDGDKGALSEVRTVSALPADFKGTSVSAEIGIHPNGRFLYVSNRGHDSLGVFAIDQTNGNLSLIEHVPTRGQTPRNFAIDPTGKWLIVTNHGSNNGTVFKIDQESGRLTPVGDPFAVAYPFCERFLPLP
jgi:6-phosphogluconolactonase